MGSQYLMSWEGGTKNRWVKMHNGVRYRISCSELNSPNTKEDSYLAANKWWRKKLNSIGPKKKKGANSIPDQEDSIQELDKWIDFADRSKCRDSDMPELNYRQRTTLMLREIKLEKGCKICGYKEHWAALDFHHRNEKTKSFNVAERKDLGQGRLLDEVKKCDVLCANCHRSLTHGNM